METRKLICVDDDRFDERHNAFGRLILSTSTIEIFGFPEAKDHVVDLEILHGSDAFSSAPISFGQGVTGVDYDWQVGINMQERQPLRMVLRIREMSEQAPGLKRSLSTRIGLSKNLKSFSSRMLGKLSRTNSVEKFSEPSLSHSTSFSSFSNFGSFGSKSNQRVGQVTTGVFMVSDVKSWSDRCNSSIRELQFEFKTQDKQYPELVGQVTMKALALDASDTAPLVISFNRRNFYPLIWKNIKKDYKHKSYIAECGKKGTFFKRVEIHKNGDADISN